MPRKSQKSLFVSITHMVALTGYCNFEGSQHSFLP